MGCFLNGLRAFGINADQSTRLQPRTRGNDARRRNNERNVSRRNKSLQRKLGMDYGMQWYA